MKNVIIIDSLNYNSNHEIFNAVLLAESLLISENVLYYLSSGALKCIKQAMRDRNTDNVSFKIIPVIGKGGSVRVASRYLLSMVFDCYLLLKAKKDTLIIYNNTNIFSTPLINLLNKFLRKKIVIFCHGEFETFNKTAVEEYTFRTNFYRNILLKSFFTNKKVKVSDDIIFLVLGDNIKDNLKEHIPNNIHKKIYSIDHAYMKTEEKAISVNKNVNSILNIGMAGSIHKRKNVPDFISLAKTLSSETSQGKLILSVAGSAMIYREELISAGISIPKATGYISRDEYDKLISDIDYILFFYKDTYKFAASGPLLDALFAEKPIIALKNDYFEYIFKKYGEFGVLLDSVEEMAELIRELINGKKLPIFDFKNIQNKLSPEEVGMQLKSVLEEVCP